MATIDIIEMLYDEHPDWSDDLIIAVADALINEDNE